MSEQTRPTVRTRVTIERAYEVVEQRLDVSGVLDGEPPLRRAAIVASVIVGLRREGLLPDEESDGA